MLKGGEISRVRKDVTRRETIVNNFDRVFSKIRKDKVTDQSSKDGSNIARSVNMVSQTSVQQSSSSGPMPSTKTALAQFFKERYKHENAKDVTSKVLRKPSEETEDLLSHGGAQMPAVAETGSKYVSDNWPSEMKKGKCSAWDAALRAVGGPPSDAMKDYRIPKKSEELLASGSTSKCQSDTVPTDSRNETISTSSSLHHSKTHVSRSTDSRSVVTPSTQFTAHSSYMQHVHKPPPVSSTFEGSAWHTEPASASNMVFTETVTRPTFTRLSGVSTVKQLASKPANKSLVSPVRSDTSSEPPFSSFAGHIRSQQQARAQVKTPSPPSSHQVSSQRQPFTYFTEAATYQHQSHRIHSSTSMKTHQQHEFHGYRSRDSKASHDRQSQAIPSTSGLHHSNTNEPPVKESPVLQKINRHLHRNVNVHSVKTQKEDSGPAPPAATVFPLSAAEVEAARSSLGQESSNQSTVYLGSFVADPNKPWPSLSVPEVICNLESSQPSSFPQDLVQVNPQSVDSVQSSRTSQHSGQKYLQYADKQPKRTLHLEKTSSIENTNDNDKVPTRHQQQHLQKDDRDLLQRLQKHRKGSQQRSQKDFRDSQIEMYSTHKSPTYERKKHQTPQQHSPQEVMIVPQLKDIEVEQMNILSNLRKKVGLGETASGPVGTPQAQSDDKKNLGDSDISEKKSTSTSRDALKSEIGRVIENVVRSDQSRQKEKKNTSLLSSQSTNEKKDSAFVKETPRQLDKYKPNISEEKESPEQAVIPFQCVSSEQVSGAEGENSSTSQNVQPRNLEIASNGKSGIVEVNSKSFTTDAENLKTSEKEEGKQHIGHTTGTEESFKGTEDEKIKQDEELSSFDDVKVKKEIIEEKAGKVGRSEKKRNERGSSWAQSSKNEIQDKIEQSPKGSEVTTRDVTEELPDDSAGREKGEKIDKGPVPDVFVAKSKKIEKVQKSGENIVMTERVEMSPRGSESLAVAERVDKSPEDSANTTMAQKEEKSTGGSESTAMAERVEKQKSARGSENTEMAERVEKSPSGRESFAMPEKVEKLHVDSANTAMAERGENSARSSENVVVAEKAETSPRYNEDLAKTEIVDDLFRDRKGIALPRGSEGIGMAERVEKPPTGSESFTMAEKVEKSPRDSEVEKLPGDSENLANDERVKKSLGDSKDIALPRGSESMGMAERMEKPLRDSESFRMAEKVEKSPRDGEVEKLPGDSENLAKAGGVEKSLGDSKGTVAVVRETEKAPVGTESTEESKKEEVQKARIEQNETKLNTKEVSIEKVSEEQLRQIDDQKELLAAKPKEITEIGKIEETRSPRAKEILCVKGNLFLL